MRQRPLILLVDDDKDYLTVMSACLTPRFDIVTLSDGKRFLETMRKKRPDGVVMDIDLPGRDGFRLHKLLRGEDRSRWVPVLFLSGTADESEFFERVDARASGFLRKPVDPERLAEDLNRLLVFWGVPGRRS